MTLDRCERCGFKPKDPRKLYYSALTEVCACDDSAACRRRQQRQASKGAAK